MTSTPTVPAETDDIFARIERALDGIRPYIASHRGSVEVIDFDSADGRLFLRLGGTCQGCAAASITLTQGIEVRLREAVPEVRHLEAI
ncbi:MAG: NifU family protein [Gemmatimonadota bacterium]